MIYVYISPYLGWHQFDADLFVLEVPDVTIRHMGHKVVEASDGYIALELFKQLSDIDLVFTDMVMTAGMSDYDLALAVSELAPQAHILMTSGYAENVVIPQILLDGAFESLRKPYKQSELDDAIIKTMGMTSS